MGAGASTVHWHQSQQYEKHPFLMSTPNVVSTGAAFCALASISPASLRVSVFTECRAGKQPVHPIPSGDVWRHES